MFNLHWWLSRHVFLQCCVYVQIHEALLCLCLYVSIKYGRVIFPMCRQLRWNSPRGRAESWSTSQRGSWYHICLNMSSIQVMEPLRFPLNNPLLLCSSYRWTHCKKMQTIKKIRNERRGMLLACSAGDSWYMRGINKENKSLTQELSKAPLACLARG